MPKRPIKTGRRAMDFDTDVVRMKLF
jgi:hypothetical protein